MKRFALLIPLLSIGCVMYEERSYRQVPGREPISALKVVAMKQAGVADDSILQLIATNGINRQQTADDIVMMKGAGASETLITAMITAPVMPYRPSQTVSESRTYYSDYHSSEAAWFTLGALAGAWWRPWHHHHHHR